MNVSTKLLRCVNCYNVNSNKISLLTDKPYRGLHEIVCSKCNRKWLVCTLHNHRWFQSTRYKIAEKHIQIVHHNIVEPEFCNINTKRIISTSIMLQTIT